MITVEECIVQSLYYRLVLITVRRGKQDATAANGASAGSSGAAAGSSADDAVESVGDGVDTSTMFQDGNLIVGEILDDDTVTLELGTDLDRAAAKYALAQGLGFLSLGSQLQRNRLSWQPTNNNDMEMIQSSSSTALSRSLNISGDAKICVTRNVRTILEAGETRLEQAFLRGTAGAGSTSTELQPLWCFGSSLDRQELNETSAEETTISDQSIVSSSQPLIDLRSCDQFSILRMEDLRDPTAQSIMMVQTNEDRRGTLGGVTNATVPGVLHSELVDNRGTLFVEGAGGLMKRETYAALQDASSAKKQLTANDQKLGATEAVHEMDSGIWDMMHALESGNDRQLFSSAGNSLASHVDLFQTTREADDGPEYDEESGHSLHRSPSDELQGTYKVFQISDTVDGEGAGADSVKDGVDGAVTRVGSTTHPKRRGASKKERDRGGLSDVLQPITVVNFAIHRVEVPMVRLEVIENSHGTISSYSKKVLDESVGTQTSIDMDDKSIVRRNNVESNGRRASSETTNNLNDDELDETLRPGGQSATDARIRKLCAEIQNLSAKEQATIGEFCVKSQKSSRCTSPFSPDHVEGQFEEDDGDGLESPRAREAYRDIVEITSVRSSERGINRNRRKSGGKHGESDGSSSGWPRGGSVRMTKSERSSPRTSRLMNADEFARCEKSPHSADGSPTRQYFAINSPEMDSLPLRSSSPCVLRISASGKTQHHASASAPRSRRGTLHSSTSSIGNAENDRRSVATIDSSLGNLCDESAELIEFERFTDWMGELPDALHNVPLSSISIPGSHICVAIEKDMRVDMDFSKCNYEMAEFLRKLPNLAIFNAFRTQMKAVWKAWMPKQCLGVHHQLEAGARYLDVRVTKYLSAFYGEHGLYTRQLKKYLKEIRLFIEEHPTEVVILHFELSDHLDRADKRRLVTVLFQVFGAKMACNSSAALPCPTLRWMWDNRKQLIVYFPDDDMDVVKNHIFGGLVWSDDFLDTVAPKKQSVTELVACLDDLFSAPRTDVALPSSGRIHVTKAVLSPDMSMVFGKFDYKSMHELARAETADAVSVWLAGLRRSLNVVAVDFIGVGDVARNIVRLNYPDRRVETLI